MAACSSGGGGEGGDASDAFNGDGSEQPTSDGDESLGDFGADDTAIEVDAGERFTIALAENESLGDDWLIGEEPDPDVAALVDDDYVSDRNGDDPAPPGSGGTRIFTFEARGAGSTTIVVHNCFRCTVWGIGT